MGGVLRFFPLILLAIFCVTVFVRLSSPDWQEAKNPPDVMIGQLRPSTSLPLLMQDGQDDKQFTLLQSNKWGNKRVKLVNFWASWCAPCRLEHAQLMQLAQDGRFDVMGINYKDKTANALSFLARFGNPFKLIGVDADGRAAINWGLYGVPETYLIDESGVIVYRHIGPITRESLDKTLLPKIAKVVK